jgi:DNA-binding transcriptional ArsR family regulator
MVWMLTIFYGCRIITFNKQDMIKMIRHKTYNTQIQIFKLLSHPARLAILETLHGGEQCVCHMEAALGYRQAYLSQQLASLRDAGIIQDRRDGWNIFYRVTDERIYDVLSAVKQITGLEEPEVQEPKKPCTCPRCSARAGMGSK